MNRQVVLFSLFLLGFLVLFITLYQGWFDRGFLSSSTTYSAYLSGQYRVLNPLLLRFKIAIFATTYSWLAALILVRSSSRWQRQKENVQATIFAVLWVSLSSLVILFLGGFDRQMPIHLSSAFGFVLLGLAATLSILMVRFVKTK